MAIGLLTSCGDDPFSSGNQRELSQAQARWEKAGVTDYHVDFRVICFCANALPGFTRLEVRAGQVVAAQQLEPLSEPMDIPLGLWPTVPAMFQTIVSAGESQTYRTIDVDYDSELGYPRRVELECKSYRGMSIADCGATYELKNLEVIGSAS